jgi:hypothetical protein
MRKHYVTFMSPGTLVSETTTKAIESWDVAVAAKMAADIVERHGAKPYGFMFSTRVEHAPVADDEGGMLHVEGREVARSGVHFLGGFVETYDDIERRNNNRESILLSNMRWNDQPLVVSNRNSYLSTHYFEAADCIVMGGAVEHRGSDEPWDSYRQRKLAEWKEQSR